MKQILVYSDSLTWGIIPGTRNRLAFEKRWPGVLENTLNEPGKEFRVIENSLNGRRTVWDDPFKEGRNGAEFLSQTVEMNSPLVLVILMLGTNDFQNSHDNNAWMSAQGMGRLIQVVRQAPIEPGMPRPAILVIAPPLITQPSGDIAIKFHGAENHCLGLAEELKRIAEEQSVYFVDSNDYITSSRVDGIHLDEDQHIKLGKAISAVILQEFAS